MELEIHIGESHWMDRAPTLELRRLERLGDIFKKGQIESPILAAEVESSAITHLTASSIKLSQLEDTTYSIKGRIIAGCGPVVVVDCGILLRTKIKNDENAASLLLRFGDYVGFTAKIFGWYYDNLEGLIHYKEQLKGKVKAAKQIGKSGDIALLLDVVEPGRDIVISPPYKQESTPDRHWHYWFGKKVKGLK